MSKDKFCISIIVMFMIMLVLLTLTAAAQAQATNIEAVSNNPDAGMGKYNTSGNLFFGDFKTCSTDAFFYFILVNNSDQDIEITLPRRLLLDDRYFYIDTDAYYYKELTGNWTGAQFADARNGTALVLNSNMLLNLPGETAYAIMGRVKGLSHELSKLKDTNEKDDQLAAEVTVMFDNTAMAAKGAFKEEGSICGAIQLLPFEGENFIQATYQIETGDDTSCSLGYYFMVENQDRRYATTVELPRWIEMNDYRWDIGCKYLYDGCLISGFRHYSYAEIPAGGSIENAEFVFCDQDRSKGDKCYEEDGLWWLNVPAGKTYAIRGMVNDLCSDEEGHDNPLKADYVDMRFFVADSGSNKWWIEGTAFGSKVSDGAKALSFISRLEDRDPDFYLTQKNIEEVIEIQKSKKNQSLTQSKSEVQKAPVIAPVVQDTVDFYKLPDFWQKDNADARDHKFPATGFPARLSVKLEEQPAEAAYEDLGGYVLNIPANGIVSEIVGIPEDESGESWAVEWLNDRTGLLDGSALPGEGISVLAGHNHLNDTSYGPFAALSKLMEDDRIFVSKPDGSVLQYRIYENTLFAADEFQQAASHTKADALVLITCEDEMAEGGYQNRRVVFAEPV